MIKDKYNGYTTEELDKINREIMQIKDLNPRKAKRKEIRETNPKLRTALAMYSMSMMVEDGALEKHLNK